MMTKLWLKIVPVVLAGGTLAGSITAFAQPLPQHNTTNKVAPASNSKGVSANVSRSSWSGTGDVLVGAAASPPMAPGNGELFMSSIRTGGVSTIPLASGADAFKIAISGNMAYVPTLQGVTYIVDLAARRVVGQFATPKGARIANIANHGQVLIITGSTSVTAYALPSHKLMWSLPMGGNALSIANGKAYLSSNMMAKTAIIDVASGHVVGKISVGNIEDSVFDKQTHTLWLADWTSGDMTIVNTKTNKVVKTIYEKEGSGFSMSNMMNSTGGFMQLAVGHNGKKVYAASFSGNIMVYNAQTDTFSKDIRIGSMAKLSGLAIDPSGRYAYTTVENKDETVMVSLRTDKVVKTLPNTAANRWNVIK